MDYNHVVDPPCTPGCTDEESGEAAPGQQRADGAARVRHSAVAPAPGTHSREQQGPL